MKRNRLITFLGVLIIALCAITVQAQSGRRQVKPPPAAPVPTPSPEPTPTPKKDDKEPELVLLVASDRHSGLNSIPLAYHSAAQRGCAERLRARSSVDVDLPERDMNRGEAIKKAKSESKTYVILLSLVYDSMARTYEDLELEFVVFAPGTAKVVISGRSYLNSRRKGPLVVGPTGRVPGGLYMETSLREAGEDAANRILKALHMDFPVPR